MTMFERTQRGRPIPIFRGPGYRRFCGLWWKRLWRVVTTGWIYDLRTFWHRGRYGWAPRDVWSLDNYLDGVLGGALAHLSERNCGTPGCFPYHEPMVRDGETGEIRPLREDDDWNDVITDHDAWTDALRRWSVAFAESARDDLYELFKDDVGYERWHAEEKRRAAARDAALREMTPWWPALWD